MLLQQTCALLHSSKLPKNLWGEAITHAVWLKNRTTMHTLPDAKTPFEMLYHKKPNIKELHEWGTPVWVHTLDGNKLDGRSREGRWISFDEVSNTHHIYCPEKWSVSVERSVKFNGDMIIPPNPITQPIQGENNQVINKLNQQCNQWDSKDESGSQDHRKEGQELTIEDKTIKTPSPMNLPQMKWILTLQPC